MKLSAELGLIAGILLLAGCATSNGVSPQPSINNLQPEASLQIPPYNPPPPVKTTPFQSLKNLYAKKVWPKQEQLDKVLVVSCIHKTEYTLKNHQPGWKYSGNGRYTQIATHLNKSPACWESLAKVFEEQERGAIQLLGNNPNPVSHYYQDSTTWALYCEEMAVSNKGLLDCLNPEALAQVKVDHHSVNRFFN